MELKATTTLLIILLINVCHQCQAKNILCLLGVATETAEKWNEVLLTELSTKGHELTIVTPTIWDDEDLPNINFIHLENTKHFLKERYEDNNAEELLQRSTWKNIVNWYDQLMATCRGNLESVGFSEVLHLSLKQKRSYDLIIYDLSYGPGCLLHFAYLFKNIPIVGITSSTLTADILQINEKSLLNPALDPYILSDFSSSMNYWKRLYNAVLYGFDKFYRQYVVKQVIAGLWSHNMHTQDIIIPKSLDALFPRFKVILANYHPALHSLTSLPANIVPVPGLHIKPKLEPSTVISSFIDHAKLGVVYIAINSKSIGENYVEATLDVISKHPDYNFIWNIGENNKLQQKKPLKNILIGNDFESAYILGHTKIKTFLTTPDILSAQESLYYGVPIITVTLTPDQRFLAKRIEEQGFGLNLELNNFNADTLDETLKNTLENKNFYKSAKQLQQSFVNQQNPSLDTAIWWVEHILQHPKANDHLITLNKESLGFFARNSYDIILLIELFIVIFIVNSVIIFRQTVQNFKKISKAKTKELKVKAKESSTKDEKSLKDKKIRKSKTKTS